MFSIFFLCVFQFVIKSIDNDKTSNNNTIYYGRVMKIYLLSARGDLYKHVSA